MQCTKKKQQQDSNVLPFVCVCVRVCNKRRRQERNKIKLKVILYKKQQKKQVFVCV